MSQPDQHPQPGASGGGGSEPAQPGSGDRGHSAPPGAPAYGQEYGTLPTYGQPPTYGQQEYGQSPAYGQPVYEQPAYHYGQQEYGQQGYGYGQPALGPDGKPSLDQPYYGIGFVDAVKRVFAKYARFDGRASRGEYWWWVLAYSLVLGVLAVLIVLASGPEPQTSPSPLASLLTVVLLVVVLGLLVPTIAVTVRRLHDADLSGWFYLLSLIPTVGGIVLLVLTVLPSKPGGARFDRQPAQPGWGG